jgi:hypothetical protein
LHRLFPPPSNLQLSSHETFDILPSSTQCSSSRLRIFHNVFHHHLHRLSHPPSHCPLIMPQKSYHPTSRPLTMTLANILFKPGVGLGVPCYPHSTVCSPSLSDPRSALSALNRPGFVLQQHAFKLQLPVSVMVS